MGQLRAIFIFTGFVGAVLVYVLAQAIVTLALPRWSRIPPCIFYKCFRRLVGLTVTCEGEPLSREEHGRLIVANHVSYFDAAVMGALFPMAFVAKSEVSGWPIMGWLANLSGTVFVNRNSRTASARDKRAIQSRLAKGEVVTLFPEGTSSDGLRVLPFKSSLFGALEPEPGGDDVWVQPVSIAYKSRRGFPLDRRSRPNYAWYGDMEFLSHMWGAFVSGPWNVVVRFYSPVRMSEFSSRKTLAMWCEAVVRAGLQHDRMGLEGAPKLPERPAISGDAAPEAQAAE